MLPVSQPLVVRVAGPVLAAGPVVAVLVLVPLPLLPLQPPRMTAERAHEEHEGLLERVLCPPPQGVLAAGPVVAVSVVPVPAVPQAALLRTFSLLESVPMATLMCLPLSQPLVLAWVPAVLVPVARVSVLMQPVPPPLQPPFYGTRTAERAQPHPMATLTQPYARMSYLTLMQRNLYAKVLLHHQATRRLQMNPATRRLQMN